MWKVGHGKELGERRSIKRAHVTGIREQGKYVEMRLKSWAEASSYMTLDKLKNLHYILLHYNCNEKQVEKV